MKPNLKLAGVAVLLCALFYYWRDAGVQAERNRVANAALAKANRIAVAFHDSLEVSKDSIKHTIGKVDTLYIARGVKIAAADTSKHKADSLIVVARLGGEDTVPACKVITDAYNARTTECAKLREAVAIDSAAIQLGQSQLRTTLTSLSLMSAQADTLRKTLDIAEKARECHIVPFVPCVSRTLSFLGGGILGVAATLLFHHP